MDGDVVVVAQKVVSEAEGRIVNLDGVDPTARAEQLAEATSREPRVCQLYLGETKAILDVQRRHVVLLPPSLSPAAPTPSHADP